MSNYPAPVLEIVNGSETINLLARGRGWHLNGFRPRTAELKNGATWQSSPLSTGRQPVAYRYDNIVDTWTVTADGRDEDGVIELAQDLERTGVDALDYWVSDWTATPVYIRARGPKETNTRYAVVYQIRVPEYGDQFRQPMFGVDQPVMEGISIIIEHGQWQNVAPGSSECVQVSSYLDWGSVAWAKLADFTADEVLCMIQTSYGRILAGTNEAAAIHYSDDDGATWGLLATLGAGSDTVEGFAQIGGNIFAAVSSSSASYYGLYRSSNNGASWTRIFSSYSVTAIDAWGSGNIFIAGSQSGNVPTAYSTDNGASFTSGASISTATAYTALRLDSGAILIGCDIGIYSMTSDFSSVSFAYYNSAVVYAFLQLANGTILAGQSGGAVVYSNSVNGAYGSWSALWSGSASDVTDFVLASDGTIYATDTGGNLWRSRDNGSTWANETTLIFGQSQTALQTSSGRLLVPDERYGNIYDDTEIWYSSLDTYEMGSGASCNNQVYVSNKRQETNLTDVVRYDASGVSYADLYPAGSFPFNLLPTTPAAGDIVYFGIDTSLTDLDTGPFSSLVFDISEPHVGWTSVAWEYWDGSAWSTLTVKDRTLSFAQTGVNSVHWVPPSDWATTSVNGVAGWWVRFRVATVATSPEPPSQQSRQIYTVVNPYVEIAAAQIGGDIPALARIQIENVSDNGGPGGSAPTLYSNRIITGLRSYSRGALFTAFLNASDEQNPVGVTVTAGTDTSFVNAVGAPSGRLAQWSPTGTASWDTICTFALETTIATQYYGTFRVFLRCRQSGGTAGQMQLRLNVATGSGGVSITTDAQEFANTNDFQILDFGQLTLPLSSYLKPTELGDTLTIAIQGYTSSTTPDCNMYDLVLIPVDEWAADFTDGENSVNSELGSGNYLDVDSVTYPKRQLRNTVKSSGTGYAKAIWQQIANGPAILQANARQRIWFLSMRTASAGSSDWRSEPDVVHRVQVWSAERYRWARGSR